MIISSAGFNMQVMKTYFISQFYLYGNLKNEKEKEL
jgi:hypothetical protein